MSKSSGRRRSCVENYKNRCPPCFSPGTSRYVSFPFSFVSIETINHQLVSPVLESSFSSSPGKNFHPSNFSIQIHFVLSRLQKNQNLPIFLGRAVLLLFRPDKPPRENEFLPKVSSQSFGICCQRKSLPKLISFPKSIWNSNRVIKSNSMQ